MLSPSRHTAGGSLTASADPGATRVLFGRGIRVLYSRGPEGGFFSGWVDAGPLHTAEGYGRLQLRVRVGF